MARPTIVLCPGAWHGPEAFILIRPKLTDAGHKVIEVDWPSVSRPAEIESFDDDIAYLSAILAAETDAGNEVVIVSHSWSGLPVVSTAGPFGASERAKQGKKGGVVKLLFIAAIVVPGGQERGDVVYAKDPESAFYSDLPADKQKLWSSKLRGHALATKYDKVRGDACTSIPSWYLACENDQAWPPAAQAFTVQGLVDQGAEVKTESIHSGHSPFLSKPDETVDWILRGASL